MEFKNLLISQKATIRDALKKLSESARGCLLVVHKKNKLLGTLTDGDLRRVILKGKSLKDKITGVYQKKPITLKNKNYSTAEIENIFLKKRINLIPIIDNLGRVMDVLIPGKKLKKRSNIQKFEKIVVVMAGGKGTRLEPFTNVLPKPLVPINNKPVIEHVIEKFLKNNISNFFITLNYKSKILKAFFQEMKKDFKLTFIDEPRPLGTAGALSLLANKIKKPFLVTNCDTIINADFDDLLNFHIANRNDITLVASAKKYVIPYGTCKLNKKGYLQKIQEKPKFNFLVNIGLYVMNPNLINLIPKNKFYNMTDLISAARKKNKQIGVYPIEEESWIDVGQWSEYRKAVDTLI